MNPEQQAHFRLLKSLEQHPDYSQREIAEATGLSLGRTNYVIHALIEKGLIKIGRFLASDKKLTKTAYILTPAGMRHRMELTQGYIARKKLEFDALREEIAALEKEEAALRTIAVARRRNRHDARPNARLKLNVSEK